MAQPNAAVQGGLEFLPIPSLCIYTDTCHMLAEGWGQSPPLWLEEPGLGWYPVKEWHQFLLLVEREAQGRNCSPEPVSSCVALVYCNYIEVFTHYAG